MATIGINLGPAGFVNKYDKKFSKLNYDKIDDEYLREFAADIAATFGVTVANVPEYVPGTNYLAGYLVRYTAPPLAEAFYYARKAGVLAAPNPRSLQWKLVPGPVKATDLSQKLTLLEAQGIQADQVVAGRLYLIDLGQDANGNPQTVNVRGISSNLFDVEGTLEVAGIITPITDIDVFTGTYRVKGTSTSPGGSPPAALQQGVINSIDSTTFDFVPAPGMPLSTSRYRLRIYPKVAGSAPVTPGTGGGNQTPPTVPPAPSGFTVDQNRLAGFVPDMGTVLTDYEFQIEE